MPIKRWKITLEYDGRPFYGWQKQKPDIVTIQASLESALYKFCGQNISVHGAGRTDAGVHAKSQIAHFDLDYGERSITGFEIGKALNAHLRPQPISIIDAEEVGLDFHARFGAKNKQYMYRIIQRTQPLTLDKGHAWHVKKKLNLQDMQDAAQHLLGEHDFSSFRDSHCQAKSPIRSIEKIDITAKPYDAFTGIEYNFLFEARAFLHHQVRNIAGTLKLVGEQKWSPDDMKAALEARDRTRGGPTAPPDGLYLEKIFYE